MAERDFFEDQDPVVRMRAWALGQMMWGAFMAAIVVVGIGMLLVGIWAFGLLLPPESKEAPSPYGAIQIVQPSEVA